MEGKKMGDKGTGKQHMKANSSCRQ